MQYFKKLKLERLIRKQLKYTQKLEHSINQSDKSYWTGKIKELEHPIRHLKHELEHPRYR